MENSILKQSMLRFSVLPFRNIHALERDKNFILPLHEHDYCHLIRITKGSLIVLCNGSKYTVNIGETCIIPPNIPHTLTSEEIYSQISIDLMPCDDERGLYSAFSSIFENDIKIISKTNIFWQFDELFSLIKIMTPINTLTLLNACESMVIDAIRNSRVDLNKAFRKDFSNLFTNNESYLYTLPQICQKMNMSKTQLERLVYEEFDCGAIEYKNRVRLSKACSMLESYNQIYNIKTISELLGFYDVCHFTNFFKKRMNMTPKKYLSLSFKSHAG